MKKRILVVGGGGREHAICWAINKSSSQHKIFCAPGNAGIAEFAQRIPVMPANVNDLAKFALEKEIDLTIVGGEIPLAAGIVDLFNNLKLPIFGSDKEASQLETSKIFAKQFMVRHNIPTARFETADSRQKAIEIINSGDFGEESSPLVIKADGLAGGKGVILAANRSEAVKAVETVMPTNDDTNHPANKILIEETITGREISLLFFTDGNNYSLMPAARDYKRISDGNKGLNTGGMGAVSDKALIDDDTLNKIIKTIILPTLQGAVREGLSINGVVFLGLMLTADNIMLLEYNMRFGDPETQTILVKLNDDFTEICEAVAKNQLSDDINFFDTNKSSVCVVMAAQGYPANPLIGDSINGLETISANSEVVLFHAGTEWSQNKIVTSGGRVLNIVAVSDDLETSINSTYRTAKKIDWTGVQYRMDIGK